MKNKKKVYIIAAVALILLSILWFENWGRKYMMFTELDAYRRLRDNPAKIVVRYDDAYIGTYEIKDEETIQEVMDIGFEYEALKVH